MIKNLPLLFLFILLPFLSSSQQIEVAELNNGQIEITVNSLALSKAFAWTFRDGTKVTDLKVEQLSSQYFLVAYCVYQNHSRMAAIDLEVIGNKFYINEDAMFKVCSAVACKNCKFFIENLRIVGCKCEETGTVSNHCHYRNLPVGGFTQNLNRAILLNKERGE
ncbi:MAG: hypothetical protein ACK4K9_06405 [Bacteroidia bacterium]